MFNWLKKKEDKNMKLKLANGKMEPEGEVFNQQQQAMEQMPTYPQMPEARLPEIHMPEVPRPPMQQRVQQVVSRPAQPQSKTVTMELTNQKTLSIVVSVTDLDNFFAEIASCISQNIPWQGINGRVINPSQIVQYYIED